MFAYVGLPQNLKGLCPRVRNDIYVLKRVGMWYAEEVTRRISDRWCSFIVCWCQREPVYVSNCQRLELVPLSEYTIVVVCFYTTSYVFSQQFQVFTCNPTRPPTCLGFISMPDKKATGAGASDKSAPTAPTEHPPPP